MKNKPIPTKRKQAEEELPDSESSFRAFVEQAPIAIGVFNLDGTGLYANQKYIEILGLQNVEAFVGRPAYEYFAPQFREESKERTRRRLAGLPVPPEYESIALRADGTEFPVHLAISPIQLSGRTVSIFFMTDITERKKAEAVLRASEEKYHTLFRDAAIGIFHSTFEGKFLDVNPTLAKIMGYDSPQDLVSSITNMAEQVYAEPSQRDAVISAVQQAGGMETVENRYRRKDGTVWHGRMHLRIVQDPEGKTSHFEGFVEDITARKQLEESLKASETLQRSLLASMPVGVIIVDPATRIIESVNEQTASLFGGTVDHLIGQRCHSLLCPADEGKCPVCDLGQTVDNSERQMVRLDGRRLPILKTVKFIHLNGQEKLLECFIDISERKQAESTLRESEERYKAISEYSHNAICIIDEQGKIIWGNDKMQTFGGYSREQMYTAESFIGFIAPESLDFVVSNFHKMLAGEPYEHHYEFYFIRADGEKRLCQKYMMDFMDRYGKRNLIISMVDLTDSKQAEEEKTMLLAQLSQAQKMESVGLLAGGIAHDFNNMLSPILGFAELLLDDIPKEDVRHARVMEIFNSAQRASALVKHILAFSRQSSPQRIVMNPALIIKEVLSMARAAIPANIAIESAVSADCGRIFADPTQLHQIAMNLITNAYHSMEEKVVGTIRVELRKEAPPATLAPGRYACLRVSDTGSGIDALALPRIFEPYFTTKPQGKGTGLGLSIIHGLVHEYGGDILVDSRWGEGTTFAIYLPLLENATEATVENDRDHAKGTERILLVDDEESIVRMETAILERLGYHVTGHVMSLSALDAFMANPQGFDLVITDMAMPLMTGLQLAQKLLAIRADLPILMCTGFSDQIDKKIGLAQGLKGLLMKPLIAGVLAKELRRILDKPVKAKHCGCILVIDDEAPIRLLFGERLGREGFEVLEAENGAQGLNICRRKRPDLVITDLIMPEKEGIETIMEMKKEFPDLPIIAISGGGKSGFPDQYLQLAKQLGAQKVFAKPLDWPKFMEAVREILK